MLAEIVSPTVDPSTGLRRIQPSRVLRTTNLFVIGVTRYGWRVSKISVLIGRVVAVTLLVAAVLQLGAFAFEPESSAASTPYGTTSKFCKTVTTAAGAAVQGVTLASSPGAAGNGSLDGIFACGPLPLNAADENFKDPPFENSRAGFQCTELANRFLSILWGRPTVHNSNAAGGALYGVNFAQTAASADGLSLDSDGVPNDPYLPGDIVSFNGDGEFGHVAVVISSSFAAGDNGDYIVTIEEEDAVSTISKANPNGYGTEALSVNNWSLQIPSGSNLTSIAGFDAYPAPQWSNVSTPQAPTSATPEGAFVSCPAPNSCVEVIDSRGPTGEVVEANDWNGSSWADLSMPAINWDSVSGIACANATDCFIYGTLKASGGIDYTAGIVQWTDGQWSLLSEPKPLSNHDGEVDTMSCPTESMCVAEGGYIKEGWKDFLEYWNGQRWTFEKSPIPFSPSGTVEQVQCVSSSFCVLNGADLSNDSSDVAEWNGRSWSVQHLNEPLTAFGCASSTFCLGLTSSHVMKWNGSTWVAVPDQAIPFESSGLLQCLSKSWCIDVGAEPAGTYNYQAMASVWNGSGWTTTMMPTPAGLQVSDFDASCMSTSLCVALGAALPSGQNVPPTAVAEDIYK